MKESLFVGRRTGLITRSNLADKAVDLDARMEAEKIAECSSIARPNYSWQR